MMTSAPFEFKECVTILKATGKKAKNIKQLRDIISSVSEGSIFHHTYQYFFKERILEYTNDFAHWAGESLEERSLAEQLSNVDPYAFPNIADLRAELLRVIDNYMQAFPEPREVLPGDEFYFNETVTLVFPAGIKAKNLAEFFLAIRYVDVNSLYYHFYEARMRVEDGMDDFSKWIEDSLEKPALAARIRMIDPFMHNLEGIRGRITGEVEEEVEKEMEIMAVRR